MNRNFVNRIHRMAEKDYLNIRRNIISKSDALLVEINGITTQSWEDYISVIEKGFKFPTTCIDSIDRYLDWMRDLSWLGKEEFVLTICSSNAFMQKNLDLKEKILMYFNDAILPFWETDVEYTIVGGKAKPFTIYLID